MGKYILKIFLPILLTFLHPDYCFGQVPSNQVDQLVEEVMKKFNIAGVAVGIVKDGSVIHNKGYGVRSIHSNEKVDENTLFAIASNSKAFTTTALTLLVEEGKLTWEDKVIDHVPEFRMYNEYVTQNFNIKDLLTHRSGLGLGAGDLMFFPDGTDFTITDVLKVFQYFEPQSAFRTKYDYDNLLYLVAGEVIARVSGMTWEDFVQQRIFNPLNMNNTYGSFSLLKDKDFAATPHVNNRKEIRTIAHFEKQINGAAGGIYSTVDDLNRWMLVHLNSGRYGAKDENQLFSEASQRIMWRIHTPLNAPSDERYDSHFSGYGLGWHLMDIRGNMMVEHGGLLPGMGSRTAMIPDLKLGIVVLTNTVDAEGYGATDPIVNTILDSYLGLEDFGWIDKSYKSYLDRINEGDQVSQTVWETVAANNGLINFRDYVGVYKDNWFGKVEVFLNNDQLWFKSYRSPKLNGPMGHYKANTFAIKWEYQDMNGDALALFFLDEEGKAQGIKMKGISSNIDFSFDFQDLDFERIDD